MKEVRYPHNLFGRLRALEQAVAQMSRHVLTLSSARAAFTRKRHDLPFDGWSQAALAAGQTAVTLNRWESATAHLQGLAFAVAGSVTRLSVVLDAARTGGTLTVTVYVAGTATELTVAIDGDNDRFNQLELEPGLVPFAAGEAITVRVTTTAAWSPTTANLKNVVLWVQLAE